MKKIINLINFWKLRNFFIYGKVNIIKVIFFLKMIYSSFFLCISFFVVKEFNFLVFNFLWNGKDKVIRRLTYVFYNFGGFKMIDYENMIKVLRLSWLKRIMDEECFGFWKFYLDYFLSK